MSELKSKNKFYVMLEKEWFYNGKEETLLEKYDSDSLMVYSILMKDINNRNTMQFTLTGLYKILHIPNTNSTMINKIKNVFKKLNNKLFIVCEDSNCNIPVNVDKLDNNITYHAIRLGDPIKEKFFMIYDREIDILIKYASENKKSREDLIAHFCFIANGFNNSKEKEEYLTYYGKLETIADKTLLSQSTLINNNKIFIKENLLLIDNVGANMEENKYKNTSNIYARVENKEQFDTYLKIKRAKVSKKYNQLASKAQQDEQRKLKQLYKAYQKKYKIIDMDDLDDVQFDELNKLELAYFNFVKMRNKELRNTGFVTIKRDGTTKKWYDIDDEDNVEEQFNDIENEVPQGFDNKKTLKNDEGYNNAFSAYEKYKEQQEQSKYHEDKVVSVQCIYNKKAN